MVENLIDYILIPALILLAFLGLGMTMGSVLRNISSHYPEYPTDDDPRLPADRLRDLHHRRIHRDDSPDDR